ncbi:MAG: tol-pal system-associated acyl-CoA thioesterase [Alphaproteobacteria bacterium]|nr:tol-pal system-associated acyl-CoA thioesterase [Alphaproteobacteria bacterium SS10]
MLLPTTGAVIDGCHYLPLRVYYEDTDFGGIVYHANFLKFAERARTEFLRCLGIDQTQLKADTGVVFAARHLAIDFLKSAEMDDCLLVETSVESLSGAKLTLRQQIVRIPSNAPELPSSSHGDAIKAAQKDGEDLASLTVTLACVGAAGRPVRLPPDIRDPFAACFAQTSSSH